MDLTVDGESRYIETGVPDTYTPVSDGPQGTDGLAAHVNGSSDAVTKLMHLLGNALLLKGTTQDLVSRLSRVVSLDGVWPKGTGFPVAPTPIDGQPFYRTDLNQVYIFDAGSGQWRIGFDNDAYALLDATRFFTGDVGVKKNSPSVRLIGTETDGKDYLIRESAGRISTYVNAGTELVPVWTEDNFFASPGDVKFSFADTPDPGWLLCDGSEVSRTTFARLYAKIGNKCGPGNGTTTFNLPYSPGRGLIGSGTGAGGGASGASGTKPTGGSALTARTAGDWMGEEVHALTVSELASHTHPVKNSLTSSGGGTIPVSLQGLDDYTTNTESQGSGTPHNTMHPSLVANMFIKT